MAGFSRSSDPTERRRMVEAWLEEHVVRLPATAELEVTDVQVDWSEYPRQLCGQVYVCCDGNPLEAWNFAIDVTGRASVFLPAFTSPLGVPASFAMYDVSEEALQRIARKVEQRLPPCRGLRQEDTGTSIIERIEPTFDLEAWEQSEGRPNSSSDKPSTSVREEHQQRPAHSLGPKQDSQRLGLAGYLFLLLALPLQLVILLVVVPVLTLFGMLGFVDRQAARHLGPQYVTIRDRTAQILAKVLASVILLGLAIALLAQCVREKNVECDWDSRGEHCYPG